MKFLKRYFALLAVLVLFAAAVMVNVFVSREKTSGDEPAMAESETEQPAAEERDYFKTFREDREEVRRLEMEYLDEVIAASKTDGETLADAQAQKLSLVENMEKEFTVESLIKAKGFSDAAVTFHAGTVNVVVKAQELSSEQVAQILEITKNETGEPAGNIKVMAGR